MLGTTMKDDIRPNKAYNPKYLVPAVKHGGGSVMFWATMSWYSAGTVITLNG
jgi:hypothetical protein